MTVEVSCSFATSLASHEHVRIAEELGYRRAWLYDSPALYPDVWVQLCRAAERTSRIVLGPGVIIPSLRHPMVTASAIVTLVDIAGVGRVEVGVGSGFTGRFTLGKKPMRWADVRDYILTVQALLRGETTTWDGARIRMMHPDGFGAPRPIEVPWMIGAAGPKGLAVAREVGAGLFLGGSGADPSLGRQTMLMFGTVLDAGESPGDPRVIDAAGHGAAVAYHFLDENGLDVTRLPGGAEWLAAYADVAPEERHLAIHDLHLIGVNDRDRPLITGDVIAATGGAFSPARLRERLAEFEASGVGEVAYQPAGPDIARELEAFISAARG
jgi:5,10-methylenetetrahydromethanopterin reductase